MSVEPLRFENGALLVLDQRLLPSEERWIRCESPEQVAVCIRTLAVRGAPAIGVAAAYGVALAGDREAAAELLRSTRPTAVDLAWAVEQVLASHDPTARARELLHAVSARISGKQIVHCNSEGRDLGSERTREADHRR